MVAPFDPSQGDSHGTATETEVRSEVGQTGEGIGEGIHGMLSTVQRMVSAEARLVLLQAKLTTKQLLVATLLSVAGSAIAVVAVIFVSLGIFHVLVDVVGLQQAWAYLIVAAALGVLTGCLFLGASSIYGKMLGSGRKSGAAVEGSPEI
jgi:hypothetical protein